jgi:hypothetical protein
MKICSARANPDAARVQKAQGCLATNLALPGLGSLAGGRKIGLAQLLVCLTGFALTLGGGVQFIAWMLAHWAEYHGAGGELDAWTRLRNLWQQGRWPLLGIVIFGISWLWALCTSWSLLADAKEKTFAK